MDVRLHSGLGFALSAVISVVTLASAGVAQDIKPDVCKPANERKEVVGCWILSDELVGRLHRPQTFWHLDSYPSRAGAEVVKGPRSTVLTALGTIWLLTIDDARSWRPKGGKHIADIGPLPVVAGKSYSAMYMEVIFNPGMTSHTHVHSGPEAWYTEAGETCLETPLGTKVGRPGQPVIVPGGLAMHLTATGTVQRRALALILHDSSKPATTIVHDWSPRGLCRS